MINFRHCEPSQIGRYCSLRGLTEQADLKPGTDFRWPQYRREVFHRFYEFHLRYRAHPGCVYYVVPYLRETLGWGLEESLWFVFLNGNTQNPVTSLLIATEFPTLQSALHGDGRRLEEWYCAPSVFPRLQFDTDRRHHKTPRVFLESVKAYGRLVKLGGGTQQSMYEAVMNTSDDFERCWNHVIDQYYGFGRLSSFSYIEYLRICGLPVDCKHLFLSDMQGSKSHRNGICRVIGRDDLDWHDRLNPRFKGKYVDGQIDWLADEGSALLAEAKERGSGSDYERDIGYFTMESALCTFKSWHRRNRRYPNVYNDMFHDRIKSAERRWRDTDFSIFWKARADCLPEHLRLENNPRDIGCKPIKQNHYYDTGEPVMMDLDWDCFANSYNRKHSAAYTPKEA